MKAQTVSISDLLADTWITGMLKTGFDSSQWPYRVTQGLPGDAKLLEVRVIHEPVKALIFLFESETFEDVSDPYALPSLVIMCESIKTEKVA